MPAGTKGTPDRKRRVATRIGRVALLVATLACMSPPVAGQSADSVTVRPGPQYEAGSLARTLSGSGYRNLWTSPVRVAVLHLGRFAGGLTPIEAGGGNQTRTLHMQGADGKRYIFRSVHKSVERVLPPDLQRTPVHDLFQDHMSAHHPTGALAVPALLGAAGVLHVAPRLVVMPDDPRLGEYRDEFAGMLGQIEERPNEGEDGGPGFAGSTRVVGMERLLERVEEDPRQVVAPEEYLAARLIDFVVGDSDRGSDQWRWVGEERSGGVLRFRPVPRDRDWAFVRFDGWLAALGGSVFPKLVKYGPRYPSLGALTYSSVHLDRRFLAPLARETWDSVAAAVQLSLTDDVIDGAVGAIPPEHRRLEADRMVAALRARRDALPPVAGSFFDLLAEEVDVHGTTADDAAIVDVLPDGSVEVRLDEMPEVATASSPGSRTLRSVDSPVATSDRRATHRFQRRFRPDQTREVRIYLLDGADRAVVQGSGPTPIVVRIIGGAGDDTLVDRTEAGAAEIAFYDAQGSNSIRSRPGSRVDSTPFEPPEAPEDWFARKVARDRLRDWGGARSISPTVGYGEGAGIIVGARLTRTRYGFRRVPYARRLWAEARYALRSGGLGAELGGRWMRENSPWSASLVAVAEQFHATRFYGLGNASPVPADGSHGSALVMHDRVEASGGLTLESGPATRLSMGLRARYLDPRPHPAGPLAVSDGFGSSSYSAAGAWMEAHLADVRGDGLSRGGYALEGRATVDPAVLDAPGAFGAVEGEARAYVPFGPTLALRAGGRKAWGPFPLQESAFVGGKETLRGFRYQRFAGDAALYTSAELRSRLTRALLLVRGDLGAFAFADAARVFVDGESPGGWHAGYGAGLSFTSVGATVSASWAYGEEHRFYLDMGVPF